MRMLVQRCLLFNAGGWNSSTSNIRFAGADKRGVQPSQVKRLTREASPNTPRDQFSPATISPPDLHS
jgi:hypothetical protein